MTGVPSKHVVVLEDCGPVDIFVEVGLRDIRDILDIRDIRDLVM